MSPEKWEKALLMEAEGLKYMLGLLRGFDELLEEGVGLYKDYLDDNLVVLLNAIRYDVNITLSGVVKMNDSTKVEGVVKQLDDVMDELHVTQAGLATKRGIPDEEVSDALGESPDTEQSDDS